VVKKIDNKVIRILVSSVPRRTRAVEDCVDRIMLDEPPDQRLRKLERKASADLWNLIGQRQPVSR
jgi:hypothetical protein